MFHLCWRKRNVVLEVWTLAETARLWGVDWWISNSRRLQNDLCVYCVAQRREGSDLSAAGATVMSLCATFRPNPRCFCQTLPLSASFLTASCSLYYGIWWKWSPLYHSLYSGWGYNVHGSWGHPPLLSHCWFNPDCLLESLRRRMAVMKMLISVSPLEG